MSRPRLARRIIIRRHARMFSKNALRINLVDNEWVSVFFHLWLLGAKPRGCVARTLVLFQQDTGCVPTGSGLHTEWLLWSFLEKGNQKQMLFSKCGTQFILDKNVYANMHLEKMFSLSYFVKEYKSKINKKLQAGFTKNLLLDHLLNIKISWLIHISLCACNKAWTKTSDRRKCNTFIFLN